MVLDLTGHRLLVTFMKIETSVAVCFVALSSFAATIVAPSRAELAALYDKAERELGANDYDAALKELDAIDARQPDLAEVQNLRGVVLTQKGEYDQAEAAFHKAIEIDPKFLHASFNLADIPFLKKDWTQARDRFDALRAGLPGDLQEAIVPLIEYKILLTFLFEDKEEKIGAILSKLKGWNASPAFAYAEAAIAFHRHKRDEGRDWIAAAKKDFSAQENKLFLESFYEVGWLPRPPGESRSVAEFSSPRERAARRSTDAQANFEQAKRAFQARDFGRALKLLDRGDAGVPNQAAFWNLRAEALLEQKRFDEAEAALRKAATADPASWETRYILAQIPFRKKDYSESRARLEALLTDTPSGLKKENVQLIRYHIFLTLLLEGKESAAQQSIEQFKFTDDTPAFYYAQAAWSFHHNNQKQASEWFASAGKLFSPALNSAFANSLADLGWLGAPTDTALSPQPAPVLLPSPANSSSVPVVAENQITPTPGALPETTPATTRMAPASDPSAVSASAENETSDQARRNSLGKKKKKRRRHRAKSTVAKSDASPAPRAGARQVEPVGSAVTPSAAPLPPGPAATPRLPFLRRLARTLFSNGRIIRRSEGTLISPAVPEPAESKATPVEQRPPEN